MFDVLAEDVITQLQALNPVTLHVSNAYVLACGSWVCQRDAICGQSYNFMSLVRFPL
jgi:hypothetical protein